MLYDIFIWHRQEQLFGQNDCYHWTLFSVTFSMACRFDVARSCCVLYRMLALCCPQWTRWDLRAFAEQWSSSQCSDQDWTCFCTTQSCILRSLQCDQTVVEVWCSDFTAWCWWKNRSSQGKASALLLCFYLPLYRMLPVHEFWFVSWTEAVDAQLFFNYSCSGSDSACSHAFLLGRKPCKKLDW